VAHLSAAREPHALALGAKLSSRPERRHRLLAVLRPGRAGVHAPVPWRHLGYGRDPAVPCFRGARGGLSKLTRLRARQTVLDATFSGAAGCSSRARRTRRCVAGSRLLGSTPTSSSE
jgi:hypothetical protein